MNIRKYGAYDFSFVKNLLIQESKNGHFAAMVQLQAADLIREYILKGRVMFSMTRNGIPEHYPREVDIYITEVENKPVSFLMIALDPNGDVELHLGATQKDERGKGYHSALIDYAIEQYSKAPRIYARCYHNSIEAIKIFQKRKFVAVPNTIERSVTTYELFK